MSIRCRASALAPLLSAFSCAVLVCLSTSLAPVAVAQDEGRDLELQRERIAATSLIEQTGDDGTLAQDDYGMDSMNMDDRISLFSLPFLSNSVPTHGWMKFFDNENTEYPGKRIDVNSQPSYVMPAMSGLPSVEYHPNQGLSGNADWAPVVWESQWFDVGGRCDDEWGADICTITGNGGFEPPFINGKKRFHLFRPGDRVAAPTATGSATWWAIYHRSWAVYMGLIRYAPNGGTGTMQSTSADVSAYDLNTETYYYRIPATLAANRFTRAGYRFTGWRSRGSGGISQPGDTQWVTLSEYPTSGYSEYLIFDAQWEKLPETTSMPVTGGKGLATAYAAGAGLCGVGFGGVVGLTRKRDTDALPSGAEDEC